MRVGERCGGSCGSRHVASSTPPVHALASVVTTTTITTPTPPCTYLCAHAVNANPKRLFLPHPSRSACVPLHKPPLDASHATVVVRFHLCGARHYTSHTEITLVRHTRSALEGKERLLLLFVFVIESFAHSVLVVLVTRERVRVLGPARSTGGATLLQLTHGEVNQGNTADSVIEMLY